MRLERKTCKTQIKVRFWEGSVVFFDFAIIEYFDEACSWFWNADSKNGDETVEAEDDDTVEGEGIGKGLNKKLRTRDEEEVGVEFWNPFFCRWGQGRMCVVNFFGQRTMRS